MRTCSFCDKHGYTSVINKNGIKYYLCTEHTKKIKTIDFDEK